MWGGRGIIFCGRHNFMTPNHFLVFKNVFIRWEKIKNRWLIFFNSAFKTRFFNIDIEAGEYLYLFVFISSFGLCSYGQYLYDLVRNQTSNKKTSNGGNQKRSTVHEESMSRERALNFDHW